jgi:ankyrin repeat protein
VDDQAALMTLIRAIVRNDDDGVIRQIGKHPELASRSVALGATRTNAADHFFNEIAHYVYAGDTALHMAAASHSERIVRDLVAAGAVVDAVNRRGARPLHYAVDGGPNGPRWNPPAQHATVARLLELGADPNAPDKNGTPPLHRAIRNRSAAAVAALLAGGADPHLRNGKGSSVMQLATWTTGKGGSGSDAARAEQDTIIRLLTEAGAQ